MSHFVTVSSGIATANNRDAIVAACHKIRDWLNSDAPIPGHRYAVKLEVADSPRRLKLYNGSLSDREAEIIFSQATCWTNEIGVNITGEYVKLESDMSEFINQRITQAIAEEVVSRAIQNSNLTIQNRVVNEDGSIVLTCQPQVELSAACF